ncbi:type II secretion system F family protein [Methanospirillum hungatei]|jgi:flagellar protein FlaJ|uniref:type II secretion system F family protein n=1 Tax=Methanospirillum hungatei TaxID=2203 RepID=UPI002BDCFA79|nr:type II secretion system F family protein [Methanospirillum hungatei]HOW04155.1 type II secretion system F family protein [Methanospirillum hungatei]
MGLFEKKKVEPSTDPKSDEIYKKIDTYHHYSEGALRFVKHPFRTLFEKPINILYVSVPAGLLVFIIGLSMVIQQGGPEAIITNSFIDDIAVFTTIIIVGPLAITDLLEGRRISSIEVALPNFFRDLAGMHESGMTLPGAIHLVSQAEYGALTPHIRQLDQRISWNFAFIDAIRQLGKEIPIPLVERSVDLVARASDAGGDIVEVLRAAGKDSAEYVVMKTDRKNNMFIYVIIILASFAVFLFVVMILVSSFLKTMADLGAESGASGQAGFNLGGFDLALYIRVFSHAGMFQGFFSGLVAGVMGEGRVTAGLKYSVLMLIIAWATFRFMV